jgi:hypothetical protein
MLYSSSGTRGVGKDILPGEQYSRQEIKLGHGKADIGTIKAG